MPVKGLGTRGVILNRVIAERGGELINVKTIGRRPLIAVRCLETDSCTGQISSFVLVTKTARIFL